MPVPKCQYTFRKRIRSGRMDSEPKFSRKGITDYVGVSFMGRFRPYPQQEYPPEIETFLRRAYQSSVYLPTKEIYYPFVLIKICLKSVFEGNHAHFAQ